MYGSGAVHLVGQFVQDEDDGCSYSNTSYQPPRDMYVDRARAWEGIIRRHQSIIPFEPYDTMLPLDDDIVIDEDGNLCDGVDFCMDIYGRIYAYDEDGMPVLTHGTHLLLSGMRRDEYDDDPWA